MSSIIRIGIGLLLILACDHQESHNGEKAAPNASFAMAWQDRENISNKNFHLKFFNQKLELTDEYLIDYSSEPGYLGNSHYNSHTSFIPVQLSNDRSTVYFSLDSANRLVGDFYGTRLYRKGLNQKKSELLFKWEGNGEPAWILLANQGFVIAHLPKPGALVRLNIETGKVDTLMHIITDGENRTFHKSAEGISFYAVSQGKVGQWRIDPVSGNVSESILAEASDFSSIHNGYVVQLREAEMPKVEVQHSGADTSGSGTDSVSISGDSIADTTKSVQDSLTPASGLKKQKQIVLYKDGNRKVLPFDFENINTMWINGSSFWAVKEDGIFAIDTLLQQNLVEPIQNPGLMKQLPFGVLVYRKLMIGDEAQWRQFLIPSEEGLQRRPFLSLRPGQVRMISVLDG